MNRLPPNSFCFDYAKFFAAKVVVFCVALMSGQYVTAAGTADVPTYTRDVMPIIQESCQFCHSPERIAPMSFMSFEEVRPWAKAIRKAVINRTMPPFHAETSLGEFENDLRLTTVQIAAIVRWVDGGAPRGNPADAPPIKEWADAKWELAEPDLIINYPKFTVSPDIEDEYVLFYPDQRFSQDTWVESIEFRGSDYKSVHHAGVFSVDEEFPTSESKLRVILKAEFDGPGKPRSGTTDPINVELLEQNYLYTWAPGFGIHHLLSGEGILINGGESIVIQAHLGPSDEPRDVSISLALNFIDGFITKSSHKFGPFVRSLEIPPGEPHHEVRKKRVVKETIQVYGSWTHMHLRGKSNKFVFHYPDGRIVTAFNIPRYNFDWQRPYFLKEPVTVPKGTTVEFVGVFDNSSDNPYNPDPSQTVHWGGSTFAEMFGVALYYSKDLDTSLEVRNGIAVVNDGE